MTQETQETQVDPIEQRKAEILAKRAVFAAAKAEREAKVAREKELAKLEQALVDDPHIAAAEEQHGPAYVFERDQCDGHKIAIVESPAGAVVVKRPHPPTYNRFIDSKRSQQDCMMLAQAVVVYPKDRFQQMFDAYPHLVVQCANAALELAKGRSLEVAGK